ncbi:MAG: hypothetical protein WBN41_03615, partial [Lysobacterales bacterium]
QFNYATTPEWANRLCDLSKLSHEGRRELFSRSEIMKWMLLKQRVNIPNQWIDLFHTISKTNKALTVTKAQSDKDVIRLVSHLTK